MTYRIVRRKKDIPPKPKYRIVRTRTNARFIPIYREWEDELWGLAYNSWVPGMDAEDRFAMMGYCLWVAWRKHDPRKDLGKFFWSIWLNFRANEIRNFNRDKRAATVIPFAYEELCRVSPMEFPEHLIPAGAVDLSIGQHEQAWHLLSLGYRAVEVRDMLGIKRTAWEAMLESWRTDEVRQLLESSQ